MTVCQRVGRWIEEEIVDRVKDVVETWEEVCDTVREWVETKVRKPIERVRTRTEERCVERPCRRACLCCNKWFCTLVTITTRFVEWVVEVVGEWVFHTVCETVRKVVEIYVDVIITVTRFVFTGLVCAVCFCDWRGLWHVIVDFWYDLLDVVDAIIGLVAGLAYAVAELLDITKRFLLDVSQWLPTVVAAIIGVVAGLVDALRQGAQGLGEVVEGAGKAVTDIGRLDFCRASENLTWGVVNGLGRSLNLGFGVLSVGIRGVRDSQMQGQRRRMVKDFLDDAGKFTPEHLPDPSNPPGQVDGKGLANHPDLNRADWGIEWRISPMIMVLSTDNPDVSLRQMHGFDNRLNLYAAGGYGTFWRRNCFQSSRYRLRYKSHDRRVRYADLYAYLENGDDTVTPFQLAALPEETIRRDCRLARRKYREMGLKLKITRDIRRIEVKAPQHIFIGASSGSMRQEFGDLVIANGLGASKCDIPMLGTFGYKDDGTFGWARTIWFREREDDGNGKLVPGWEAQEKEVAASYRDARPELVLGYVVAHELGHCFGLRHDGHDSLHYIMFQNGENDATKELPFLLIEFLLLGGEPRFTDANTMTVWDWIVNVAPECLPPPP